jgi:hypothetical protein
VCVAPLPALSPAPVCTQFIYLETHLRAPSSLLGLSIVFTILVELPVFHYSASFQRALGIRGMVCVAHVAYIVRVRWTCVPGCPLPVHSLCLPSPTQTLPQSHTSPPHARLQATVHKNCTHTTRTWWVEWVEVELLRARVCPGMPAACVLSLSTLCSRGICPLPGVVYPRLRVRLVCSMRTPCMLVWFMHALCAPCMLCVCCGCVRSIRAQVCVYPTLTHAALVLPVELLHGLTYALIWPAGVAYAARSAPAHLTTTSQVGAAAVSPTTAHTHSCSRAHTTLNVRIVASTRIPTTTTTTTAQTHTLLASRARATPQFRSQSSRCTCFVVLCFRGLSLLPLSPLSRRPLSLPLQPLFRPLLRLGP